MKTLPLALLVIIIAAVIWDGVWKLIALWKSARNNELAWFVCVAIFNTVGILPILYILFFQKTETEKIETGIPRPPQFQ
jgi:predicted permease